MNHLNIYDFFDSKDIATHCQNIGHTFTALEMAYIIRFSHQHTLEQKHAAWQYLMDHYPDEEMPDSTLHRFLRHHLAAERQFLTDFAQNGYIYDYAIMYSGENHYQADYVLYDNYEACFAALQKALCKDSTGARITRRKLYSHPEDAPEEDTIHLDKNLGIVMITDRNLDEDPIIQNGFARMQILIPTPFQKGDLVTCSGKQDAFILQQLPHWKKNATESTVDRLNLHATIYRLNQDGRIFQDIGPHYLLLEYSRDTPV